ncbi:hypothetical protein CHL9426_01130 [Campylobacter hyointestinalis subsp. lawsonii]|nr:hypothetical protein CHL9752_02185 [Campylobacter hyointestinalis subsp. lawsonii]RAZ40223.1 hypothetical protein CHL9426_01130 [Campylobacter hyointestinalis subsp. lawsonii]
MFIVCIVADEWAFFETFDKKLITHNINSAFTLCAVLLKYHKLTFFYGRLIEFPTHGIMPIYEHQRRKSCFLNGKKAVIAKVLRTTLTAPSLKNET